MIESPDYLTADLTWVSRLLTFVLREEADRVPEASRSLLSLANTQGKLLRPRLALTGARSCWVGTTAPNPGIPKDPELGLQQLKAVLESDPVSALRRGVPELAEWGREVPFEGALPNRFYLLAAVLELLHLATLTHDDVVDDSPLRRGQPSAKALLGNRRAILVGDLLLTLCFGMVNEAASHETARLLAGMVRLMVHSEFSQMGSRTNLDTALELPDKRRYLRVIGGKTALLFAASLASGAMEAGGSKQALEELGWAGYYLGMAFQIEDDILDFTGNPDTLGKPLGQDLRDCQLTLPVIEALSQASPASKAAKRELCALVRGFANGHEEAFPTLVERLGTMGGLEAAKKTGDSYLTRASRLLRRVADSCANQQAATALLELPGLVLGRKL